MPWRISGTLDVPPESIPLVRDNLCGRPDHLSNFESQRIECKRFGQHVHTLAKKPAANCGILHVACNKEHLNSGSQLAGKFGKLLTIDNWETHIGQQQIELSLHSAR